MIHRTLPNPGQLFLEVGTIKGSENSNLRKFWLEYRGEGGAMIAWSGFTRADAIAVARNWTRHGIRLIDNTERLGV